MPTATTPHMCVIRVGLLGEWSWPRIGRHLFKSAQRKHVKFKSLDSIFQTFDQFVAELQTGDGYCGSPRRRRVLEHLCAHVLSVRTVVAIAAGCVHRSARSVDMGGAHRLARSVDTGSADPRV